MGAVLASDSASMAWLPSSGGEVSSGAIQGGVTSSGEPLNIGRGHHKGNLTIGKFHPSHKTVYVPFSGVEYGYSQYEILVHETINFREATKRLTEFRGTPSHPPGGR
ncbi:uncharacterized protein LOC144110427 [Amblyomma americanum]